MAKAGVGAVRILDQSGDNVADDSTGALKVVLQGSEAINIGAVEIKDENSSTRAEVNANGELLVTAPPATFDTVTSVKVDTSDDTSWHRLPNNAGKEVLIQSLSGNVDTILLGKYVDESSEVESIELLPATTVSMAINNTQLLSYKKVTNGAINQYLLLTVLSNA